MQGRTHTCFPPPPLAHRGRGGEGESKVLIMSPHTDNLDHSLLLEDLIHQAELDVDPARETGGPLTRRGPLCYNDAMQPTDQMPYCSLNAFLRSRFGGKVVRVPLNLHRPCPNRQGGLPGCAFCLPESYEPQADWTQGSIAEQLECGMAKARSTSGARKFIAYLQSGSNTAGPVAELEAAYTVALQPAEVVALSIATRPDCLPDDVLDLLGRLAHSHEVWVELGVQTVHDRTLELMGRRHTAVCSIEAVKKLCATGVQQIVLHMILGLPGESETDIHESFRVFSGLAEPARLGFKLHHLQVVRDTPLEQWWRDGRVKVYSFEEYARLVVDVLERVPAGIPIHRLFGSVPARYLCVPIWPGTKAAQRSRIQAEFAVRGTWQGKN